MAPDVLLEKGPPLEKKKKKERKKTPKKKSHEMVHVLSHSCGSHDIQNVVHNGFINDFVTAVFIK